MTTTRLTPGALEFIEVSKVRVGDTLVNFTAIGKDVSIPATQRQLDRLPATRVYVVPCIHEIRTGVVDLGNGPDRWTALLTSKVWRVKR